MTAQPQPQSQPSSPLSTKFKHAHFHMDPAQIISLDDPQRTTPLHPSLPSIKLPATNDNANTPDPTLNPLTLKPFTADDLKHHNYHTLRLQFTGAEAASRARDEAVHELKSRLDDADRRTREVEREMEEKEKTREIERKVWMKRRGEGGAG